MLWDFSWWGNRDDKDRRKRHDEEERKVSKRVATLPSQRQQKYADDIYDNLDQKSPAARAILEKSNVERLLKHGTSGMSIAEMNSGVNDLIKLECIEYTDQVNARITKLYGQINEFAKEVDERFQLLEDDAKEHAERLDELKAMIAEGNPDLAFGEWYMSEPETARRNKEGK